MGMTRHLLLRAPRLMCPTYYRVCQTLLLLHLLGFHPEDTGACVVGVRPLAMKIVDRLPDGPLEPPRARPQMASGLATTYFLPVCSQFLIHKRVLCVISSNDTEEVL